MKKTIDIHKRKRRVERQLERIRTSKKISERNKKIIEKFYRQCVSVGLSDARIDIYLTGLYVIATRFSNKDFDKLDKDDIKELVTKFETNDNWTDWTKQRYRIVVRKLIQFLEGHEWNSKKYPEKVNWISTNIKKNNHRLPNEILTKDDVKKMIKCASSIRDKAFISVLYESGCRIGEILTLKVKDVSFDEYGCIINVFGKTGSRRIRLVFSTPYLSQWLQLHNDPNSFVWTNINQQLIGYNSVQNLLKRIAKMSGIEKKVNPHSFRHARATHLANKLTEAQMKEYFGWTQGSKMASVYVHLSGRDIDDAILKIYGKKPIEKEKQDEIETKTCIRCGEINPFDAKYCKKCGTILNKEDAMKMMDAEKEILNMITPEMIEKMIDNKVKEMLQKNS